MEVHLNLIVNFFAQYYNKVNILNIPVNENPCRGFHVHAVSECGWKHRFPARS